MKTIFITGIGTDVGKTLASAIVAEALGADYWKPVQAGLEPGTDTEAVTRLISGGAARIHREAYTLSMPASPHISARAQQTSIVKQNLLDCLQSIQTESKWLVVEGAGGLMVPLSESYFVADLIRDLGAKVIIVSRNYLGSINHSLLTADALRRTGADVAGWIFNDQYLQYEDEIVHWSGYPRIGSIPFHPDPDAAFVVEQAGQLRQNLLEML